MSFGQSLEKRHMAALELSSAGKSFFKQEWFSLEKHK
jgi:hypothetical protein